MIGTLTENSQLTGTLASGGGQGVEYIAGTGIDITENVISNTITSYNDLSDKPTIPTVEKQSTYFEYNNKKFYCDATRYGKVVVVSIYMNEFNQTGIMTRQFVKLAELGDWYRPTFEVVAPVMYIGVTIGTAWIDPNGELWGYFDRTSYDLFRLTFTFITE